MSFFVCRRVGWIFFQVWYTYIYTYIYIYSLFFRFTTFYGQYADIFQVPSVSDITNHLLYILNHPSDIRNMSFAGMSWRLPGLSGRRCRAPRCTRHSSWRRTLTKKKALLWGNSTGLLVPLPFKDSLKRLKWKKFQCIQSWKPKKDIVQTYIYP